jgi:uroporphyrinogen-III synthase
MVSTPTTADTSLNGLTVLVSRPAGLADKLIEALRIHGAESVHVPLLEIVPNQSPQAEELIAQRIQQLGEYQHVIFVSINAVQYAFSWLSRLLPDFEPGQQIFYGIGNASCAAIREHGVEAVGPQTSIDSEGLLALPQLQHPEGQRVLIFRGVGGREYLAQQLRLRGAEVDYCEVYQRCPPAYKPGYIAGLVEDKNVRAIIATSGEALENLLALLSEQEATRIRHDTAVVTPGERVAGLARQNGFERVIVAENAGAEALVAAISGWWQDQLN